MDSMITLASSDGKKVQISQKAAMRSKLLNDVLKDYENEEIPLPEVNEKTLVKVVEYLEHYKDSEPEEIAQPLVDANLQRTVNEFEWEYLNSIGNSLDFCYDIINAANYMDIHSLLNLICAYVASMLYEEEPENIRTKLGIESDMTEDEKKEYEKFSLE